MGKSLGDRATVLVPALLAAALLVVGVVAALDWHATTTAAALRSDVLGRERMLVYNVVDLAGREPGATGSDEELTRRIDLLVNQWEVGTGGGEELDLALRPTGRSVPPWREAAQFDAVGDDVRAFADDVRVGSDDGVSAEELSRWREAADALVGRLIPVVRAASDDRAGRSATVAAVALAASFGLLAWIAATVAARRRRTADVLAVRGEEATRAADRFTSILQKSPDDIVLFDAEGELTWASSGLGVGGIVSSADHLWSLVHPDDRDRLPAQLDDARRGGGATTGSYRLRASYGQWRHVEILVTNLLEDDGVDAVVLTVRDVTDREVAQAEARRLAAMNQFLTANASEALMRVGEDGVVVDVTPAIEPLLLCERTDVMGMPIEHLLAPASRAIFARLVDDATRTGTTARDDVQLVGPASDHLVWTSAGVRSVADQDGTSLHVSLLEVTDRRAAERALAVASAQSELILDTLSEGVALSHRSKGVIMANTAAKRFGVAVGPGQACDQVLRGGVGIEDVDGSAMEQGDSPVDRVFRSGGPDLGRRLRLVPRHGAPVEIEVNAVPCGYDANGDVDLAVLTFADVTAETIARRQLERQATSDALTGLANRHQIEEALDAAIRRNRRRPHHVSLLFVDLDGFKAVNDELGHGAGDEVLVAAARRLGHAVRAEDVVGRIGGDEFVILVEGPTSEQQGLALVGRLEELFRDPFDVSGVPVEVGASIGLATMQPGQDASDVLSAADREMYDVKRRRSEQLAPSDSPST